MSENLEIYRIRIASNNMMTSSNGNIFLVAGLCAGNSPVNSPHKGQWCGTLMLSFICAWISGWVNNREAGDLRRNRSLYDATVMIYSSKCRDVITLVAMRTALVRTTIKIVICHPTHLPSLDMASPFAPFKPSATTSAFCPSKYTTVAHFRKDHSSSTRPSSP